MTQASLSETVVRVSGDHQMLALLGERDTNLRHVEEAFPEVRIVARGTELHLSGEAAAVKTLRTVLEELVVLGFLGDDVEHEAEAGHV